MSPGSPVLGIPAQFKHQANSGDLCMYVCIYSFVYVKVAETNPLAMQTI